MITSTSVAMRMAHLLAWCKRTASFRKLNEKEVKARRRRFGDNSRGHEPEDDGESPTLRSGNLDHVGYVVEMLQWLQTGTANWSGTAHPDYRERGESDSDDESDGA